MPSALRLYHPIHGQRACGRAPSDSGHRQARAYNQRAMRCWLTHILICLALGAIVNVAVAWMCALWSPLNPSTSLLILIDDNDETWMGGRSAGFGIARFTVFGSPGVTEVGRGGAGRFPRWVEQPEELLLKERVVFGMDAGWPLPALVAWRTGRGELAGTTGRRGVGLVPIPERIGC